MTTKKLKTLVKETNKKLKLSGDDAITVGKEKDTLNSVFKAVNGSKKSLWNDAQIKYFEKHGVKFGSAKSAKSEDKAEDGKKAPAKKKNKHPNADIKVINNSRDGKKVTQTWKFPSGKKQKVQVKHSTLTYQPIREKRASTAPAKDKGKSKKAEKGTGKKATTGSSLKVPTTAKEFTALMKKTNAKSNITNRLLQVLTTERTLRAHHTAAKKITTKIKITDFIRDLYENHGYEFHDSRKKETDPKGVIKLKGISKKFTGKARTLKFAS
jgi:hypothetical protein